MTSETDRPIRQKEQQKAKENKRVSKTRISSGTTRRIAKAKGA